MKSPTLIALNVLSKTGYRALSDKTRYQTDIAAFAEEVLGISLTDYQKDILRKFLEKKRVVVRAPHGGGKTAVSSIVVLWAVSCFDIDVKVITTASAWRQLVHYTWPEIHKWASVAQWEKLGVQIRSGVELLSLTLTVKNRKAFAAASDNPATLEGAHATMIVVVFDEAKAISATVWDALEGAFSAGTAYALAISTPGETSGRFYDIYNRREKYLDWETVHITIEQCVAAGRILPEWVTARRKQWGERSAVYQNRVLAEFATGGENTVIPLTWIEKAIDRWRDCNGEGTGLETYGVDPAYQGDDRTAIARLVGKTVVSVEAYTKEDTMETAGRIAALAGKDTRIAIDIIGVGAGVFDRLKEQRFHVVGVNAASTAQGSDSTGLGGFVNKRAELWWGLREALDPQSDDPISLPDDDELLGDLTAPTWKYNSRGLIQIESKDDIRERIDRSTDKADAVALALWAAKNRGWTFADLERYRNHDIDKSSLSEAQLELRRRSGLDD